MRSRRSVPLVLVLALQFVGCVTKGTHRRALADVADARDQIRGLEEQQAAERQRASSDIAALRVRQEALRDSLAARERDLARLERRAASTEFERRRLEELAQDRGSEAETLRRRLDALAAVEAEVRERNRIYENILARFRSLIDGGQLSVEIRNGRMIILLPQDVLFTSGNATLSREGRETVTKVGEALATLPERRFQVEGHTDNVPIATARFPSNWELSAARALTVVHLLTEHGVPSGNISAAGYGEFHPASPNDTPEGRRSNRRIEVVMLPDLDLISELSSTR